MKYILSFIVFVAISTGCSESEMNQVKVDLLSEWELVAHLMDPGDGSGEFVAVESNRTLSFYDNGEVVSTGSLCDWSLQAGSEITYTYDAAQAYIKTECGNQHETLPYLIQGDELILNYQCIEPCKIMYRKIN